MAQGYSGSKSNMEDMGERYFEKLVMHSFFQDFEKDNNDDDNKIIRCKMHDMVHDFASMTTNECFTIDIDKVLEIDWKSARHLTLELNEETQFPVSIYNAKNLRTLFLRTPYFGRMVFPFDLFQHLTCLRSLNLKETSFEKVPNEVEKLKHLRLLNLSYCSYITELPETLCNLCNLQTLDISWCRQIRKLPQGMGKLIKLRHLLIDGCYELTEPFPKGIGRLSSLRTLEKFKIGGINNIGECKLGELKNLVHLKGYLEIGGLENVTDVQEAENAQLKNKIHLRNLRLQFGGEAEDDEDDEEDRRGENDELVLNALEPHPELESLEIHYYRGTGYPNWLMSLTILKELELYSWDNLEQLPPLGKLRFLESLDISDFSSVKKVGVEFLGIESNRKKDEEMGSTSTSSLILFPNLKSLKLINMKEWEEWDGMGESGVSESVLIMPRLQVLTIQECPELKALPNWVMSLTNLKKLGLGSCNKLEQLPPLGKLRFLESLRITGAKSMKKVGVEFLGIESNRKKDEEKGSTSTSSLILFPNLKSLEFGRMEEWEEWDGMGESGVSESVLIMPRLQVFIIVECPMLKSLPNFLEKTSLEILTVDCRISNWMTLAYNLLGLKILRLNPNNNAEHLPPLGKLLLLESLEIWGLDGRVKKVGVEFLGIEEESNYNNKKKIDDEKGSTSSSSSSSLVLFPNLKSLEFWGLYEWEEWDGIGGTMREEEAQDSGVTITIMPRLQYLTIYRCPKLKSLPDFLPTTPLKTLKSYDCPILSECCQTEIGDQWPKISHIPNIQIYK